MLKPILAGCLALAPTQAAPDDLKFVIYPLVHKVSCDEGSGSAFRIGGRHWISVDHVATLSHCEIDGSRVIATELDAQHDFARLDTASGVPNGFKINCHGFIPGQWFFAIGHALGKPYQTLLPVYATYAKTPDGKRVLIGDHDFIPGMSGGPVINEAGEVVGTVNAFIPGTPISLSRELRDTSVCPDSIA